MGADEDIRPSWPVEQVAALLPNAQFHLLEGAEHVLRNSHAAQMKVLLLEFIGGVTAQKSVFAGNFVFMSGE